MKLLIYIPAFMFILFSCKKNTNAGPQTNNSRNSANVDMNGTWVLYQYQVEQSNTVLLKSDTLRFSSNSNYTYNQLAGTYYLYDMSMGYRVTFKNTVFGDVTGIVPYNYDLAKEINGVRFSTISTISNTDYVFWFRKL